VQNPGPPAETSRAVFLSYASQDADAARRLCDALRAGGIEVWFDQSELRGGDAWDTAIRRQIKSCALFIPVISRNTHAREEGYFRLEWKLAVDRSYLMSPTKAFLLPVVVDDTGNDDEHVPERFREVQWTRLPGGEASTAFVARVARLLSGEPAPASAAPAVATPAAHASQRAKAVWLAALGLLVLGGVWFAVDKLRPPTHQPSEIYSGLASGAKAQQSPAVVSPGVSQNSIAVLPFTDMSEKKDQEYFSDGLAETLLDLLAKTPGLHVIARTSSFSFKGKSDDIPTIAQKLRVANVLEGSVRRSGNHLRVTTQLIRAADDEHLWSETYDRQMSDVFKVQDDIAAAVVAALKLKLAPDQKTASQRTVSPDAYVEYLIGEKAADRFDHQGFQQALVSFKKAVAIDPEYGAGYAGISFAELMVADDENDAGGLLRAQAAADKAIELAPNDAAGYFARSFIRTLRTWDWVGAQADIERAIALDPGSAEGHTRYGLLLLALGRVSEGREELRKSVELDPLATGAWAFLARAQMAERDFPAAQDSLRHALEISPDAPRPLGFLGFLQLLEGHPADALSTFRRIKDSDWLLLTGVATAEYSLGHAKESQAALERLQAGFAESAAYQIAEVYAWRGEKDLAFNWLERAYAQRDAGMTVLALDPVLDSLRGDPRFAALKRKLGLPT